MNWLKRNWKKVLVAGCGVVGAVAQVVPALAPVVGVCAVVVPAVVTSPDVLAGLKKALKLDGGVIVTATDDDKK